MWGLRFTVAAAAALAMAGCVGQSGPSTTISQAPAAEEPAPAPRATRVAEEDATAPQAEEFDAAVNAWGPRAIDIGDYDAYVSTAEAAAAPTPPPVHLGDYDQRRAAAAAPTPPPVHLGDYDQRRAAAAAPTPPPVHLGDYDQRRAAAAAPTSPPVHLGDYDQRRAAAAAPTPPPVHLGDYDRRHAAAAAPTSPPVHLGDYDRRRAAAAPPPVHLGDYDRRRAAAALTPVHLGDYDQRRAAARFGPLSTRRAPAAPNAPTPRLRGSASETIVARVLAAPQVRAAQTAVRQLMSPVYDDGDFAPQTPGPSAGELKAPPPRGRAANSRRARYDSRVARRLADAAMERTRHRVRYDGRYVELAYPWGDVPEDIGVCTDVVVRTYRGVGVDLQRLLHEDIRSAFNDYPSRRVYGKSRPDRNIDHRRVVNLERFLERQGADLPVSYTPDSFQPGDVVSWRLNGTQPHIGVVVEERDPATGFPLVVHNIGSGPKADNILALQEPVGHYRYTPRGGTRVAAR